jgi:DmsE family decaheme c-type cytochrome
MRKFAMPVFAGILVVAAGCISLVLDMAPASGASRAPSAETLQAAYIEEAKCIACHGESNDHWSQTVHARIFRKNPRNDYHRKTCEACHGPGSEHAAKPSQKELLIGFTRKWGTPVDKQNATCLQCHKGRGLIHWEGSVHEVNDLSCSDCHNPMANFSQTGLLRRGGISQSCLECHRQVGIEFRKRSHMPLPEGKLTCSECHNPHGTNTRPLIKADTVNLSCTKCHAEKRGPFIWEHAPVRESCLNCHSVHGSNHEKLLMVVRPFLCQQCHSQPGHPNDLLTAGNLSSGRRPDARLINRSCLNCHSQIHGSNHPSGARFHR